MKIADFGVEMWLNENEENARYHLSETCAKPFQVKELLQLAAKNENNYGKYMESIAEMTLDYGYITGSQRLKEAIAGMYRTLSPENITAAHGLGVYNDMTGHGKDTAEWLGWLQNGGWYGEEPNALAPMPAFWQNAPVGGEFTSSIPMKTMLRSQLSQTVELVQQSHMSFLGPKVAEETYRG